MSLPRGLLVSMSSSRRSSRSTKFPGTPVWRSMSVSKKSVPASVSFIFAEPEQGAPLPLASATTKLPPSTTTSSSEPTSLNEPLEQTCDHIPSISSLQPSASRLQPSMNEVGRGRMTVNDIAGGPKFPTVKTSVESLKSTRCTAGTTAAQESASSRRYLDPTTAPQQSCTVHESPGTSSELIPHVESNATMAVPFPSSEPETSALSSDSSPGRSSWFGSLSRTKGKDRMAEVHKAQAGDAQNDQLKIPDRGGLRIEATATPLSPSVQVQPPTPPQPQPQLPQALTTQHPKLPELLPSEPQPIPATADQQQPKRGWFSSTPNSPARPGLSPTTPSPLNSSHTSLTSSLDDEVPSLSALTPPASAPPIVVHSPFTNEEGAGRARLSSLNPSTSRFTLSIPLLGRAKIPLDEAVAVANRGDQSTIANSEAEQVHRTETKTATLTHATTTAVTPNSFPGDQGQEQQSTSSAENGIGSRETCETITSSSSWWDYVVWGTAPALQTGLEQTPEGSGPNPTPSSFGSDTATVKPANLARSPSAADEAVISEPTNDATSTGLSIGSDSDAEKYLTVNNHTNRASSVRSAETSQSQASAWYSPWTWYGGASSSTTLPAGEGVGSSGSPTNAMTQSELVKEEALARTAEEPSSAQSAGVVPQTMSSLSSSQEGLNPIESTIATNRSGWASFFSSKTLVVKSVTGGETAQKETGMEVMDLDLDEDPRPATDKGDDIGVPSSTVAAAPAEPAKGKDQGKQAPERRTQLQPQTLKDNPPASPSKKTETTPSKPTAPPLTISDSVKRETVKYTPANNKRKSASPTPSKKSGTVTPAPRTPPANLVLPTWGDTFHASPRNLVPPPPTSKFSKTMKFVSGVLFAKDDGDGMGKGKAREREFAHFGKELPRAWDVVGNKLDPDVLNGCSNVVVIGIHGWFPGAVMRTVLGEPTGTSGKFVNMMVQALEEFQATHNVKLKKVTTIPLEGEGTIDRRVEKLYTSMLSNKEWLDDLHAADAIFVATHSQGSIVSTHLLDRLIHDQHIRTSRNTEAIGSVDPFSAAGVTVAPIRKPQKICCLALCGIHLGPLRYLSSSSLLQPYIQYFESTAARELFEFQSTESQVSKAYTKALRNVLDNGTKMVYVASLNDQVVPIYSGLFTCVSHPLILRALYIDGDAYHSSDFLSNLLVLLLRVLNSGVSDSGLLAHLSEATAGSLNGVGHSTAYEELATYSLAVKYLFLTNDGLEEHPELILEPFNATSEQNDYEIPWALRDLIADERVVHFFSREIIELRDAFRDWHPKTTILRDIKRKLQPIQRLPPSVTSSSVSKL